MTDMANIASLSDVKKISVYVVESHWKQLQAISRATGIPASGLLRRALVQWLKRRKRK
jgi:Ribbon-helix-helix domain